jgi:hypothetical protein
MPGSQGGHPVEHRISGLTKRRLTKPGSFGFLKRLLKETPVFCLLGVASCDFVDNKRLCVISWITLSDQKDGTNCENIKTP